MHFASRLQFDFCSSVVKLGKEQKKFQILKPIKMLSRAVKHENIEIYTY